MSTTAVAGAGQLRANLLEARRSRAHLGRDIKAGAPPSFPAFQRQSREMHCAFLYQTSHHRLANLVFTNTLLPLVHRSARYASGRVASRKTTPSGQSSHHETMY